MDKKDKCWQLFLSTFKLSACTFGGGFVIIPLMRERFVKELHWIEEEETLDLTAIAQSSPGSIAINASILVGYHVAGIPGALITVLLSVSNIVLNNFIGIYGSDAVASYGIAYKVDMVPIMLSVGLSQGVAPLIGYYYGAGKKERMSQAMKLSTIYGIFLGALFLAVFGLLGPELARIFLHDESLVHQAGYFISILGLSAPMLGIINMVTSYFQALGVAVKSLMITMMRNIVLFIPVVILLNSLWKLNGVIAAQPVVETILAIVCIVMYARDSKVSGVEFYLIQ